MPSVVAPPETTTIRLPVARGQQLSSQWPNPPPSMQGPRPAEPVKALLVLSQPPPAQQCNSLVLPRKSCACLPCHLPPSELTIRWPIPVRRSLSPAEGETGQTQFIQGRALHRLSPAEVVRLAQCPLQEKPLMRLRGTPIYGHSNKSLGIALAPCLHRRTTLDISFF